MTIPSYALAAGWIPFTVVVVLCLLFSAIYIRFYMSKYDSELSSTLATIFALFVTLLTSALVPVDIFLVSFMKTSDGLFKDWAGNFTTRESIENAVLISYYVFYALITFCLFLLLPFMYFYFEEKDDDENPSCRTRSCSAMKFTVVFLIIAVVLLLIGAFVPLKSSPPVNSTEWDKIEALFKNFGTTDAEDALSFVMSILSLLGMLALVTYTAYGMSAWPLGLLKGKRNIKQERMTNSSQLDETRQSMNTIRNKYDNGRRISSRDRARLSELEDSERLLERRSIHLDARSSSCIDKCLLILRPFEVVFGVIFVLIAILIFVSLLLTNIDKIMHSTHKIGYALPKRTLPNPVDIVLVYAQLAFPLDYILMCAIILYFVFCSMSGIRNIGIWFFWLKMYKIRPRRTKPQGLLMLCMIMIFIVLAINIMIYELTPQYSSFGSQHYIYHKNSTGNATGELKPCATDVSSDYCVITRMALLLTRFFYKMWFFGAAYYWATWVFLGVYVLGFVISIFKKSRSSIDGEVEADDFTESDEELIT